MSPVGVPLPSPPGAPTSTVVAPKFEKSDRAPVARHRRDADVVVRGRVERARRRRVDVVVVVLVAGGRHDHDVVLAAPASIASPRAASPPPAGPPRLRLITVAPFSAAKTMPFAMFALLPLPSASSARTGMILRLRRHAGHALAVVGDRGRGAGHVGAVEVEVVRRRRRCRRSRGPGPPGSREVGVGQVHAGVHDGDHLSGAARAVPGGQHVHAGRAAQAPLVAEEGVVRGGGERVVDVVRLGVDHARLVLETGDRVLHRAVEAHHLAVRQGQRSPRSPRRPRRGPRAARPRPRPPRSAPAPRPARSAWCRHPSSRDSQPRVATAGAQQRETEREHSDELAGHQAGVTVRRSAADCQSGVTQLACSRRARSRASRSSADAPFIPSSMSSSSRASSASESLAR